MSYHRKLIAAVYICLIILVVSVAYKAREDNTTQQNDSRITGTPRSVVPASPDSSFFNSEDAKSVIEKAKPQVEKPSGIPGVTAVAYLVGNVKTGKVYLEKNSSRVMPVASMSKLVTAFVATDVFPATSTIVIDEQAVLAPPDSSHLMVGERFTLQEILEPLLLNSSNVAAEAISSTTDQNKFMELMRSYAWEVGMPHSFFADPSGVSPQNVASAKDIFGLAKYLMYYRPDILALTRAASSSVATTTDHGSHQFSSTHPFINDPRFIGGKTGRTLEAGETMVTMMNIVDQPIAIIILGARYGARENDTRILLQKFLDL